MRLILWFLERLGIFPRRIELHRAGAIRFAGDVGVAVPSACVVTATIAGTAQVARGITVRFRTLSGPVRFAGGTGEILIRTDTEGRAAASVEFAERSAGLIVAELPDYPGPAVAFEGHSDGCTDAIFLYAPPTFPADPGVCRVRIRAVDHHEQPVTGAPIHAEALHGRDTTVAGTVRELGGGLYEAEFQIDAAGEWTLTAYDAETRASTHVCAWALPGSPARFSFVDAVDPRAEQPYGEVLLRVRLEDARGQALDPHRIRASIGGSNVAPRAIVGDEARFHVARAGYGSVDVSLSDADSELRGGTTIEFASAWLGNPGVVLQDQGFRTRLYWLPPRDRPVGEATISIRFPHRLARFSRFTPVSAAPVAARHTLTEGLLSVSLSAERPIDASRYPDGVYLADIDWDCLGEGTTCFDLAAAMSPLTEGWRLCVEQKREEEQCLCVNIIYQQGDGPGRDAGRRAARRIAETIGQLGNVQHCCPFMRIGLRETEISNADWTATIVPAIGADGAVTNANEQAALLRGGLGQRAQCLNFLIAPLNWADGRLGSTYDPRPLGLARGFGVISTAGEATDPNVGAHEAGHALGLNHTNDRNNLMFGGVRPHRLGINLTEAQCETVWRNLGEYPC